MPLKIIGINIAFTLLFQCLGFGILRAQELFGQPQKYHTEIPYETVRGIPVIQVAINGKTFKFLFDTGAKTTVSNEIYSSLKTNPIGRIKINDGNLTSDSADVIKVKEIVLGGIGFKNVTAVVSKQNSTLLECLKIDGIIGSDFLYKSIVQISNESKTIILTTEEKRLDLKKKRIIASDLKFFDDQFTPYFAITFINNSVGHSDAAFDTGFSGFLATTQKVINYFNGKGIFDTLYNEESKGNNAYSYFGFDKDPPSKYLMLQTKTLYLNRSNFVNFIVQTNGPLNFINTIGNELLKYGVVIIDYKNRKFYFSANAMQPIDVNATIPPFGLSFSNNKPLIGVIFKKELKEKFSIGDQIIAIDDFNLEKADRCFFLSDEFAKMLQNAKSITYIEKNGNRKKLEL